MLGAGNVFRTRDPEYGKLVLFQLSYTRTRPVTQKFAMADSKSKTAFSILAMRINIFFVWFRQIDCPMTVSAN